MLTLAESKPLKQVIVDCGTLDFEEGEQDCLLHLFCSGQRVEDLARPLDDLVCTWVVL